MTKRHEIVEYQLQKYPVAEDIDEILDRLSFRGLSSSQVPDWKLFTRRNGSNEFAAVYGNREFFVKGPYSSIELPQRDLENITRYVFNENWVSRKIRGRTMMPMMAVLLAGLGVSAYDFLNKDIDVLNTHEAMLLFVSGIVGGAIVAGAGVIAANSILNRYYGSKLSREAESYSYGKTAEDRLREEFIFERIKSGELGKQDFLKLRGYEL